LTLTAFLAHNFWVYTLFTILILIFANFRENNPTALFFFILFTLPNAVLPIPGMGLINVFFHLSHTRILELFILLPAFFVLIRRSGTLAFGRTWPDILLAAYILLTVVLYLRETSVTDTFRQAFYMFIDVFLPYFVISRSLKDLQSFRAALLSLVVAVMVIALIAVFESAKHWLLYTAVLGALGLEGTLHYLGRGGSLRAVVTAGHAIALGYLLTTGIGIYLYLQHFIRNKLIRRLGMALLAAGLIASLSRGPWIGAVFLIAVFIATGRNAIPRLMGLAAVAVVALSLIAVLPGGEKVINLLPFIGKTEISTIEYRKNLFDTSMIVIERNPWFGSVDYLNTPEMESMRQGQGIIDIVNTYIQITLEVGLVGLGLFVGFFALILLSIYRAMRSIRDRKSEERLLGRALFATMLSILLIIFTVSSIGIVPIVYWSVAGLGVAYAQMMRRQPAENIPVRPEKTSPIRAPLRAKSISRVAKIGRS
jgi:O-antigen ligase